MKSDFKSTLKIEMAFDEEADGKNTIRLSFQMTCMAYRILDKNKSTDKNYVWILAEFMIKK